MKQPFFRSGRSATIGGVVAVLLWSTTIAIARSLSESLGPLSAAAATCLLSGLLATGFSLRTRLQRQAVMALPRAYLFYCAILFAAYTIFLYLAVGWSRSREETLIVGLLNYLWPILTLLLSLPLLKRRAKWTLWPASLLALMGLFLVLIPRGVFSWAALSANPLAFLLAFLAAVSWALYSNLTRRWAAGTGRGGVALFLLLTAFLLLPIAMLSDEPRQVTLSVIVETIFLGLATFMGYSLWDLAMRNGHLSLVTSVSYLTPLLSTLVSVLYLGLHPGIELWLGCLLLMIASFASWRSMHGPDRADFS